MSHKRSEAISDDVVTRDFTVCLVGRRSGARFVRTVVSTENVELADNDVAVPDALAVA